MCRILLGVCLVLCVAFAHPDITRAENWPSWRGPRGDGTSQETGVPIEWDVSTGKNVRWKVPLPGKGHASPIVWGNDIFLVTCLPTTSERALLCLDRTTGKTKWQRSVLRSPLETKHALNSRASGTPATDGETVFVTFLEVDGHTVPAPNVSNLRPVTPGHVVVAAYDFDGNRKWFVKAGEFISAHGFCSCPVLFENLVIINGDHDGESYLVALDKATGKKVWQTPRRHKTRSYATPIIREIDGRTQMVLSGSKCVTSFDPRDGSRHWTVEGPTEQFIASMVFDGRLFFVAAGFPTYHVMAIDPLGQGDVTDSHVVWHVTTARCYVPSPVVVGDYLLVADDRGTANCFDTATGRRLWQIRLGKHYSSSLVTADGLVYFQADDGITKVVKPGPQPKIIAENRLGEYCYASPAISNGQLFFRAEQNLYCISSAD